MPTRADLAPELYASSKSHIAATSDSNKIWMAGTQVSAGQLQGCHSSRRQFDSNEALLATVFDKEQYRGLFSIRGMFHLVLDFCG